MNHKVGDGTTLFNFVNDWAIINQMVEQEKEGLLVVPVLGEGASIFPQRDSPIFPELKLVKGNKVVYKRFVFQASMIKSLKKM
ncbi:vinorine synthase-like, partial [Trifolium medium]|nr:vinorine synthase-like [Trifolium medium]